MTLQPILMISFKKTLDDKEFRSFFSDWVSWMTKPMREGFFDFGNNDDYFEKGFSTARTFHSYIDSFNKNFIFYGRTEYGLFRLLQKLKAKVSFNKINDLLIS